MKCDGCKAEVTRARFVPALKEWLCRECDPGVEFVPNVPGSMFPYMTAHIGKDPNKPIKVQSLRHLRKLESQHGVHSVAFNQDSHNFDSPPRAKEQQ